MQIDWVQGSGARARPRKQTMTPGANQRATTFRFFAAASVFLCAFLSVSALDSQEHRPGLTEHAGRSNEWSTEGREVFESRCAACHGLDGRGGERGPDVATRAEVQRLSDEETLHILQNGMPAAGMPAFGSLGPAKMQAVVGYLRALQGKGQSSSLAGNPQKGKSLFFGKAACGTCHLVNGRGGFVGADLSSYGSNVSIEEIRTAITDPNKNLDPRARTVVVTTQDGRHFTGMARNEDNFSLQLQSVDGVFHLFAKQDLQNIEYQPKSLMPADYGSVLSRSELDDLVGFLVSSARAAKQAQSSQTKAIQEKEDD